MEEEEKIVKGDDDVELDATLEDLYIGGSLKLKFIRSANNVHCPNVKYETEGYFFVTVDGQVQALVGYEETIKHLDEHLVDISTKGVTKPKEVRKFKGEGMPLALVTMPSVLIVQRVIPSAISQGMVDGFQVRPMFFQGDYGQNMGVSASNMVPPSSTNKVVEPAQGGSGVDPRDGKGILAPQPLPFPPLPPPPGPPHLLQPNRDKSYSDHDMGRDGREFGWQPELHENFGSGQD
ncbi:hypothetical protein C3L33_04310, partial [Rhododendron williamsianum]